MKTNIPDLVNCMAFIMTSFNIDPYEETFSQDLFAKKRSVNMQHIKRL